MSALLRQSIDVEGLLIAHFLSYDEMVNLVADRVYWKLPSQPTYPLLTLHRMGGIWRDNSYLDQPIVHIESWGGTREQAYDIISIARAALIQEQITKRHSLGVVTGTHEILGPTWLPDAVEGRARWFIQVRLYTHPLRAV